MIASDGYEYESLAHRLLGEPKESERNEQLRAYREADDLFDPAEVEAWRKAYDEAARARPFLGFHDCHRYGLDAMREFHTRTFTFARRN